MAPSLQLARWIRERYPYSHHEPMTHLKLQKLLFYCVGAAFAFDEAEALRGEIRFQPWEHGPVNREVWQAFRHFKGAPMPSPPSPQDGDDMRMQGDHSSDPRFEGAAQPMMWAIKIYGVLDAWSLRQQSHLESPWIEAFQERRPFIPSDTIRDHFKAKFRGAAVAAPQYLQDPGTFTVDHIPVIKYSSMAELADRIYKIYGMDELPAL